MRVKILVTYGVIIGVLCAESVFSVLLTSTLITGFMGGFIIGRMNLGQFVSVLSNNGTFPSLGLPRLPSLSSLLPRDEEKKAASGSIPVSSTISPQFIYPPMFGQPLTYPYYYYPTASPQQSLIAQVPVVSVSASTSAPVTSTPQGEISIIPIKPVDVSVSLDNKIRERFISQLALMDPLHCLPKIFCEVSADPYGTAVAIDHGTIAAVQPSSQQGSITLGELEAYELHLKKQTTTSKPKPESTTKAPSSQSDLQDDDKSSSEEDDSRSDEEVNDSIEEYHRKEDEHKLEMQALEEMVDEIDDPLSYYYILKDKTKSKGKMKKYKQKHQKVKDEEDDLGDGIAFRDGLLVDTEPEDDMTDLDSLGRYSFSGYADTEDPFAYTNRRFAYEPPEIYPPPELYPPRAPPQPKRQSLLHSLLGKGSTNEDSLSDDMFADDPFFDDFKGRSSRKGKKVHGDGKNRSYLRRRSRQNSETESDLMKQYRAAYKIAEKYRSPDMCRLAFPSCPYQTKTILKVVNRLESGLVQFDLGQNPKTHNKNDQNNLVHFKNTLLAIERLNKATLQVQQRGEPFNTETVMEMASSPSVKLDANSSKNIIKEFQQVVSKIKTAKLKKQKRKKKKKDKKKNYDEVHYYKKAQMESLKPKDRIPPNPQNLQIVKTEHDDEVQISRRKWEHVPTFKETYSDIFKDIKVKTTPPAFTTTKRPKLSRPTAVSKSKPIKKFSEDAEDDEMEAQESEKAINAQIAKPKPNRSPIA